MGGGLLSSFLISGGKGIHALQGDFENQNQLSNLRSELKQKGCSPVKMVSPTPAPNGQIQFIQAPVTLGAKVTVGGENNIAYSSGRFVCDATGFVGLIGADGIVIHPYADAKPGTLLPSVKDKTGKFDWKAIYRENLNNPDVPQAVITAPERIDDQGNVPGATPTPLPTQLPLAPVQPKPFNSNQQLPTEKKVPLMTDRM